MTSYLTRSETCCFQAEQTSQCQCLWLVELYAFVCVCAPRSTTRTFQSCLFQRRFSARDVYRADVAQERVGRHRNGVCCELTTQRHQSPRHVTRVAASLIHVEHVLRVFGFFSFLESCPLEKRVSLGQPSSADAAFCPCASCRRTRICTGTQRLTGPA